MLPEQKRSKKALPGINSRAGTERVPDPARRPGPEEKLVVNEPKTRFYPGPNFSQARELYSWLDWARDNVVNIWLEYNSQIFKSSLSSSQLISLPEASLSSI